LLPKLRDVDVRKLSGAASAAAAAAADLGKHKLSDTEAAEGAGPSKAAKKADDKSVDAARARYLARKAQQTTSGKGRR
jgi:ATP-dependent RNA helicase DHX8/PRP22